MLWASFAQRAFDEDELDTIDSGDKPEDRRIIMNKWTWTCVAMALVAAVVLMAIPQAEPRAEAAAVKPLNAFLRSGVFILTVTMPSLSSW